MAAAGIVRGASVQCHFSITPGLDDVAEDIGMVGSAILYHYPDKRELYRAVLESLTSDLSLIHI